MKTKLLVAGLLISVTVYSQKELKIKKGKVYDKEELVMYCESEKLDVYRSNYKFKTLKDEVVCTMEKSKYPSYSQFYVNFPSHKYYFTANFTGDEESLISALCNNEVINHDTINQANLFKYAKRKNIQLMGPVGLVQLEKPAYDTGNKEVNSFFNNLEGKYKPVLSKVTYTMLSKHFDYIKGSYFFFEVPSSTFSSKSKVENGKLSYIAWINTEVAYNSPSAPIVFQMPENTWVKERKSTTTFTKYKYEYNHMTKQGDFTTIVAEPTSEKVMGVVDDVGTVKQMPVVKIVGIADKYGVWEVK